MLLFRSLKPAKSAVMTRILSSSNDSPPTVMYKRTNAHNDSMAAPCFKP